MSEAVLGYGAQLFITNDVAALIEVTNLISVNRPNFTVDSVDTTTHDSANATREFIAGLLDPGELNATLNYVPGDANDLLILEHIASREKRAFKITIPNETTSVDVTGTILITTYEPDDAPIDDKRTAAFNAKVSGATTQVVTP